MTKIMLVEDDKNLRDIYGVRLFAEGYDIVSAGDGEEALAMAIKERPKLIISDVMMPKISGFDMLDILRSTTETKEIKVIMMTALSSDDQRQRGESLGADRYVVKSQVGIEDVVRIVHEVLGDGVGGTGPAAASTPASPQTAQTPTPPPMAPSSVTPSVSVPPRPTPTAPSQPTAPQTAQTPTPPPMPVPTVQSIPVTDASVPTNPTPVQPPANPVLMPTPAVPTATPTPAPNPTGPMPANISHAPTPGAPAPAGFKDRVIQPLPASKNDPLDINALLDKELAKETLEASTTTPTPPNPPQEQPPTQLS